jgi:hypothetical protein
MTDYKNLLGLLAVLISLSSYAVYFYGIWRGTTKPHAFTWFVWGTLNIVGLSAVLISGGESGAWVFGVNAITNYVIAGIGFYQGRVQYDRFDWLALSGALLGIILWWQTNNPLYAVVLVSLSDAIGVTPTIRKAYRLPFEENASAFVIGLIYYIIALFALEKFTLTTSLYHFAIMAVDLALVSVIFIRRRYYQKSK